MEYVFEHFKLSNTKQPIVLHDTKIDYKTESTVNWHRNIEIFLGKSGKGMVIEITDPDLLEKTGGIVQGMSGSPIIQNGKLVGAVSHVFVNEPEKGYACFVEWMLDSVE